MLTALGTVGDLRGSLVDPDLLRSARHVHVSSYFLQKALRPDLPTLFEETHALRRPRPRSIRTGIPAEQWDGGIARARSRHGPVPAELGGGARASPASTTSTSRPRRLAARGGIVAIKFGDGGGMVVRGEEAIRVPGDPRRRASTRPGPATRSTPASSPGWLAGMAARSGASRSRTRAGGCRRARPAAPTPSPRWRRPSSRSSRGRPAAVIVCVAANPSVDKLFEVERLVPGDIHRPIGFVQVAGGKGLNVARAAHALGAEVPRRRAPARPHGQLARGDAGGRGRAGGVRVDARREPGVAVGRRP